MNSKHRRKAKRELEHKWPHKFTLPYDREFYRFKNHLLHQRVEDFKKWLNDNRITYHTQPLNVWENFGTVYLKHEKDYIWVNLKWS